MTNASSYLCQLAEQIVEPYTRLPQTSAAMITGSAAKGLSDHFSDIDLTIYYDQELPSADMFEQIRHGHGADEPKWTMGEPTNDSYIEAYDVQGIEVQIGHTTVGAWEKVIAQVREELDCESPLQKAMEGTLACKALYGAPLIERWKAEIAQYPPALGQAMVEKHLKFFAVWGLEEHFRTRDATFWYYETLVESAQNIIGVLAGLNQLYFTTFQFKRMEQFIQEMEIAPHDLYQRLEGLFQSEQSVAIYELEKLVSEVIQLVEVHLPSFDTTPAKRRIGWRHEPWVFQDVLEVTST